jgi:hypothetical protein
VRKCFRIPCCLVAPAVTARVLLLVVFAVAFHPTFGQDRTQSLVGRWYGEIATIGEIAGRQYNSRRWLRINEADGTQNVTWRLYLNGTRVGEETMRAKWGVNANVYWTECASITIDGRGHECGIVRSEYSIDQIDDRQMKFTNLNTHETLQAVRVSSDFKLP